MDPSTSPSVRLERRGERVLAHVAGRPEAVAVELFWPRPVSDRGGPVSLMDAKTHREVALLPSLDALDAASRRVAEEALAGRYVIARILRVRQACAVMGSRLWDVETDRGPRRFVMKEPHRNVAWINEDRLLIRDTMGNRFEIASLAGLDPDSRAQVELVL